MDSPSELLGTTARWTAAVRAAETLREDGLLDDPWAEALAGPEGMAWRAQRDELGVLPMILRARYFDDVLLRAAWVDGIRQVVLMAAGYDTRAYRLDWPSGTRVFEIDRAEVLERKREILDARGAAPACERHAVAADLAGAWREPLARAGLALDQPAIWLLEGFLFYLPTATVRSVLEGVLTMGAPGSEIGFDVVNEAMLTSPFTRSWVEMQARSGAPWLGTLDDPGALLEAHGWTAHLTQCGAPDANHGRWTFPVPGDDPSAPHLWLVTGRRS